jgi:hypothetical protein
MWTIPDLKPRKVLSVVALQMAKAEGLVLTRLIERELKKMSTAAILERASGMQSSDKPACKTVDALPRTRTDHGTPASTG